MNCYSTTSFRTSHISITRGYNLPYSSDIEHFQEDTIYEVPKKIYEILIEIIKTIFSHFETDYSSIIENRYSVPTESFPSSFDFLNRLSIPNIHELSEFIIQHEDILPVMLTGCNRCSEYFGGDTDLILAVVHDPESNFEFLELNVRKSEYEDNFMEIVESLCDSFWNDLLDKSSYFVITTDFQPPTGRR